MTNLRSAIVLALMLPIAACGWRRTPVPLLSDSGSTALLVGKWSGDYNSKETGRSGSISFELASEKDTAYCDVVMVPKVQNVRIATQDRPEVPVVRQDMVAEALKIRFIRLGEGRLTGTLEPYTDPECGCRVSTTFEGRFTGESIIEGTYVTKGDAFYKTTSGSWKVSRQKTGVTTP